MEDRRTNERFCWMGKTWLWEMVWFQFTCCSWSVHMSLQHLWSLQTHVYSQIKGHSFSGIFTLFAIKTYNRVFVWKKLSKHLAESVIFQLSNYCSCIRTGLANPGPQEPQFSLDNSLLINWLQWFYILSDWTHLILVVSTEQPRQGELKNRQSCGSWGPGFASAAKSINKK